MNYGITVFTPTYNRAHLLDRLYQSLLKQTNKNFIWLLVDDGSQDDTQAVIQSFINENQLDIIYKFQENQGKYVAHNTGVKLCETELFVCVDSDDELYPDAIQKTLDLWKSRPHEGICGIVSPRDLGGKAYFTDPPYTESLSGLYNKRQLKGDSMLVFATDVLQGYLFPEVKGENFMSEEVVYLQIDQKYKYYTQDEYLYKGEYQNDGLTNSIEKTHWRCPRTTLIMYKSRAVYDGKFINKIKAYASYLSWKEIRELREYEFGDKVSMNVRIVGRLLKSHYDKLFRAQSKKYIGG